MSRPTEANAFRSAPDYHHLRGKRATNDLEHSGNPLKGINEGQLPMYAQIESSRPVHMAAYSRKHIAKFITRNAIYECVICTLTQ